MSRTAAAAASLVMLATAPVLAGDGQPALSKATLDYVVSATCTLTTPSGAATVPCSGAQWSLTLQPGWSATMALTYDYHYTDDGLPMNGWLIQPSTGGLRPTFYESAGLYASSFPACGHGPCIPLQPALSGDVGLVPVVEFDNSVPDDVTGSRTLTLTATWSETYGYAWNGTFGYLGGPVFVNSVPEPSTWALFAVSIAALAFVRRRRSAR